MLATLTLDNFGDTFLAVAAVNTAFAFGAAFGFRRAIKAVTDCEDGEPDGRFVRWFVESDSTRRTQVWRGWGIGGVAVGVWLGGGFVVVVLPLSLLIWGLWVR